jgi:hypothetical protein
MLSRESIVTLLKEWKDSWNSHDLAGVMGLFHENIIFENWDGAKILGKEALRKAWKPWFAQHGDFTFVEEETFVDEVHQKALFRWILEWNSNEPRYAGMRERRKGLDVLHFKEGKIIRKYTYSKTMFEIEGKILKLIPDISRSD